VQSKAKRETLRHLLRTDEVTTAIVFCNRKTTVRELAKSLKGYGFSAGEIHGDMDQSSRIAELDRFKAGTINILVASDVAARGLDVKGVSHVFNFDTPWHPDDYVHRIGRTGRAGATGRAFTFVAPEDAEAIENVEKLTGGPIPLFEIAGGDGEEREDRPARSEKPRSERAPREDRPRREREPRAAPRRAASSRAAATRTASPDAASEQDVVTSQPPRRPRDDRRGEHRQSAREHRPDTETAGEGWNGPIPGFLNISAL
jgi:superfamily II DNA/RNA helicase